MNNLKIAYRFLISNKSQALLISLGITIGVAVQIFLGLLINNLQSDLLNKTVGNSPQITISSKDSSSQTFTNQEGIINEVENLLSEPKSVITPLLDTPSLLTKDGSSQSILVRGLSLEENQDVYNLKDKLISGTLPTNKDEVIIGKDLAEKYNINTKDIITFLSPNKTEIKGIVSGVVDLKVKSLNENWVITSLTNAQEFFNLNDKSTSIEVKLPEDLIFEADSLSQNLSSTLPTTLKVSNWKESNEDLLSALTAQQASSITIQVFIIASVIMGIAGVLAISVMQKSKQIGILKSMGIKNSSSACIFLYQGGMYGVIGALGGSLLALILFKGFNAFVKNADGSSIVSGSISFSFIALSMGIAILSALLSSLVAARKSLKLDPIDIIRNS